MRSLEANRIGFRCCARGVEQVTYRQAMASVFVLLVMQTTVNPSQFERAVRRVVYRLYNCPDKNRGYS